jgi:galactose-1-phosphate uridylyltransferase
MASENYELRYDGTATLPAGRLRELSELSDDERAELADILHISGAISEIEHLAKHPIPGMSRMHIASMWRVSRSARQSLHNLIDRLKRKSFNGL